MKLKRMTEATKKELKHKNKIFEEDDIQVDAKNKNEASPEDIKKYVYKDGED
jgi:hypothetical protein